jgi:hypothetical protein
MEGFNPTVNGHSPPPRWIDALEAQSIYIFREAFARLKKLALLWSLGKFNVMIWLARRRLSTRAVLHYTSIPARNFRRCTFAIATARNGSSI